MFRAIAHQVEGDDENYEFYRKTACREINASWEEVQMHAEPAGITKEEYLRKMERDTEWGTDLEIRVLARFFNAQILVHRLGKETLKYGDEKAKRTFHIAYHEGENIVQHYSSVIKFNPKLARRNQDRSSSNRPREKRGNSSWKRNGYKVYWPKSNRSKSNSDRRGPPRGQGFK